MSDFSNDLAEICEGSAGILLHGSSPKPADSSPIPYWEQDRQAMETGLGSDEPHRWINTCVSKYLSESANQLLALGALLRAETVAASLDPLVRAIIERVGAVNWLIEPGGTTRKRVIRSGLSFLVCLQHYRDALSMLEGPKDHRTKLKAEQRRISELMPKWFAIDRPPTDPDDENSKLTMDPRLWVIESEKYPGLTDLAGLGLDGSNVTANLAAGSYYGFSGFAHPNVVFGQEHQSVATDGAITFTYPNQDLEKTIRFAVGSFGEGLKRRAAYYEADEEGVVKKVDELSDRLDSISALPDKPCS